MLHIPVIAAISLLALTGAAAAAPSTVTHTTSMAGRIAPVDPDRRAMVIAHGTRELTLTIAVDADIHAGARALSPQALRQEVGRPVKVRYTNGTAGRVVDMVEVVPTDPA